MNVRAQRQRKVPSRATGILFLVQRGTESWSRLANTALSLASFSKRAVIFCAPIVLCLMNIFSEKHGASASKVATNKLGAIWSPSRPPSSWIQVCATAASSHRRNMLGQIAMYGNASRLNTNGRGTELDCDIVVQGWLNSQRDLWRVGTYPHVRSPMLPMDEPLGMRWAKFEQSSQGGTTTTLNLVAPWFLNGDISRDWSGQSLSAAPEAEATLVT